MITAQDVQTVTFDKTMRGYHTEQVDCFLDQIVEQLGQDSQKISDLEKENAALKEKLYLLAQKIEEYRADEDNLKSALLNAQRMGENVVREAKQKADAIEREAKIRAEGIVSSAAERCREEELEYERIRVEVSQFKANVLGLYRQHIESLSTLPEYDGEGAEAAAEEEPAAAPAVEEPETVEAAPVAEEPAAPVEEVPEEQAAPAASFWDKELSELTQSAPKPAEKPSAMNAFQGIRFSD